MLEVFVQKSHSSCKSLLNWLNDEGFAYRIRYIDKAPLSEEELLTIISYTENGFEDILSYRALKSSLDLDPSDLDSLTVKKVIRMMLTNPVLIRKPIVIRNKRLFVGYDKTQVGILVPKEMRMQNRKKYYSLQKA